jgi:hypothetical protein
MPKVINTKVGKQFTIKGSVPVHMRGQLRFSRSQFTLVSKVQKEDHQVGSTPPTIYTLQAKRPGSYEIKYEKRSEIDKSSSSDNYKINVRK